MTVPKGVDPEKWGRPTWVLLHALAYLASVCRMDVSVVRGTFLDMRLLLPCKKCRVGLAEIIRAVPPPEDAEALLPWVNEAHNVVNRKKGRAEVAMDDGLGGRIASMDAKERRVYVLVATVRAASYMRKCIAEREQYEQYRREMPSIRAAWSRFALVAKSMPVALRSKRKKSSFGEVRVAESEAVSGLRELISSQQATSTPEARSPANKGVLRGKVYEHLVSRKANESPAAFAAFADLARGPVSLEVALFGETSPRYARPTAANVPMLQRMHTLLTKNASLGLFVRDENMDIAKVEWGKLRRTYEACVALGETQEDDSSYTHALMSFLRTANESGCAGLNMFGGAKHHIFALLSRAPASEGAYKEAVTWVWNGDYEPLYKHVFTCMQKVRESDLEVCCMPLAMLSAYTDASQMFRDAVNLARDEKCRCHESLVTKLSRDFVAQHEGSACGKFLRTILDVRPDETTMLLWPTWSNDAKLACLFWNVSVDEKHVREKCRALLPQALDALDATQLYRMLFAYGYDGEFPLDIRSFIEEATTLASSEAEVVSAIARLSMKRPELFVKLKLVSVQKDRWEVLIDFLSAKRSALSIADEVEMLTTHRIANDAIVEFALVRFRGFRLARTLRKLRRKSADENKALLVRLYKTYGKEIGLIESDDAYLLHLAELVYANENGGDEDANEAANREVLTYIEEQARKTGSYAPLQRLVARLGGDAGDSMHRAFLHHHHSKASVAAAAAQGGEVACRILKWKPGACQELAQGKTDKDDKTAALMRRCCDA